MIERLSDPSSEALARLAEIHAQAFEGGDRAWSAAEIGALAERGILMAAEGGFALLSIAADEAELLTLAVLPSRRRRGLGARLLAAGEAAARGAGAARLFLEVAADNAPARSLYAAAGYGEAGRRPGYYRRGAERVDALLLAKDLGEAPIAG